MVKRTVTFALLFFVVVTICVQLLKGRYVEDMPPLGNGIHLLFFHARVRCPTCRTMEKFTRETLSESFSEELRRGDFDFIIYDYESSVNKNPAREVEVATAGLILVEVRDGNFVRTANLLSECWLLVGDSEAFKEMLRVKIREFLCGGCPLNETPENDDHRVKIELNPEINLFENEE